MKNLKTRRPGKDELGADRASLCERTSDAHARTEAESARTFTVDRISSQQQELLPTPRRRDSMHQLSEELPLQANTAKPVTSDKLRVLAQRGMPAAYLRVPVHDDGVPHLSSSFLHESHGDKPVWLLRLLKSPFNLRGDVIFDIVGRS